MTQVAMSACAGSASPSGTLTMRSSWRPAARDLGIEVVLVRRPAPNGVETVASVPEAVQLAGHRLPPKEKRGV